ADLQRADGQNSKERFEAAYEANAQVILCGVSQPVRMILDLAQLDQVFAIVESLEAIPPILLPRIIRSESRLAA
ncbi:MAG: hypothetical protein RLZZ511_4129, partial [Cyanobacteriota bacterium]